MIRDSKKFATLLAEVRQFVQAECRPLEEEVDRNDEIPASVVRRMRELGLFGHSIPIDYGGAGLTTEELSLVNIEVSQVASSPPGLISRRSSSRLRQLNINRDAAERRSEQLQRDRGRRLACRLVATTVRERRPSETHHGDARLQVLLALIPACHWCCAHVGLNAPTC